MSLLDRVKAAGTKLELELAPGIQKVTVILEQKVAAAAAAAEGEAKALANAVTPELEAEWAKIEASIQSHTSTVTSLVSAHQDVSAAGAAVSDAVGNPAAVVL